MFFKKILLFGAVLGLASVFTSCDKNEEIFEAPQVMNSVNKIEKPQVSELRAATSGNQCVDYIRNRLGINAPGHAKDWGPILEDNGYTKQYISTSNPPQKYDIIIYHTDYGNGISSTYGHIGMVASSRVNGSRIEVDVVGANQHQKNEWSEYGCDNVSIMTSHSLKVDKVSIYRQ